MNEKEATLRLAQRRIGRCLRDVEALEDRADDGENVDAELDRLRDDITAAEMLATIALEMT
jgi:hypothetical protein